MHNHRYDSNLKKCHICRDVNNVQKIQNRQRSSSSYSTVMAKYESNVIDNLKDMIARYISVIFHFDTRIVQLEFAS